MAWSEHIDVDPQVLAGKPIIKGTRISVELVLDLISSGATVDDILREHPHLSHQAVLACVAYAADSIRDERIYPVAR